MNALVLSFKKWLASSSQKQKRTAALFAFSLLSIIGLILMNGASTTNDDPLQSSPFYFVGVFAKLVVVLLLILACSAIFRRWFQPGASRKKGQQMQVIETVRLSSRQALHIVSVGDRQLLIGATDQNVSLLTAVEVNLPLVETTKASLPVKTDFSSLLQSLNFHAPVESSQQTLERLL